jgi:hypothetical protein
MPLAVDQHMIQALTAKRSHEPLGEWVRPTDRTGVVMAGLPNGHAPAALSSLLDRLLNPGPQAGGRRSACLARHHLPVPQHQQRRDGLHGEALLDLG